MNSIYDEQQSVFERFLDLLVDRIIAFTDYFIIKKHVTLSETTLFAFASTWTAWFIVRGVYVADGALGRSVWISLFGFVSTAHFVSFFFNDILGRAVVACMYAFLWSFLMFISLYTGDSHPSAPTLSVFMMLSVFIAVRLFRDRQQQRC